MLHMKNNNPIFKKCCCGIPSWLPNCRKEYFFEFFTTFSQCSVIFRCSLLERIKGEIENVKNLKTGDKQKSLLGRSP